MPESIPPKLEETRLLVVNSLNIRVSYSFDVFFSKNYCIHGFKGLFCFHVSVCFQLTLKGKFPTQTIIFLLSSEVGYKNTAAAAVPTILSNLTSLYYSLLKSLPSSLTSKMYFHYKLL